MVVIRLFQRAGSGGGGSNFTDRIPLVFEVPEGVVAYPDVHSLATATAKISGFVLPDGASSGIINFKCMVPSELASSPAAKLVFIIMTLGAVAGPQDVHLIVSHRYVADTESYDVAFTAETGVDVEMPVATETQDVYSEALGTQPVAADHLVGQLERDPANAGDTFTDDIIIVGGYLEIDRTTT